MKLDCRPDFVTLVWTEDRSLADTSLFRLGNCFPTSVSAREAVFSVGLNDCNFRRLVTGDQLMYTNDLTYISSPDSHVLPFTHSVVCAYQRQGWYPLIYDPVFNTYGQGDLVFHIGLMNVDFSGPAESTSFPLGSFIPIMASVEQKTHQPLLLLLEECVAATTPELRPESSVYPIITNKGCLVDSKISHSKFEQRQKSSEIHLSLQAFRFALGEEVFIHCKLVAWDPAGLDKTNKACHYVKDHGRVSSFVSQPITAERVALRRDKHLTPPSERNRKPTGLRMDWFHCNQCFTKRGSKFAVSSCGHICCEACIKSKQCSVCGASCSYLPITDEMKPQEKVFFKDPVKLIQSRLEHISQIALFQRTQMERVMAQCKRKCTELERHLKEVTEQSH
ncbi:hypothetical protein L3Q82_021790, partial [Scortum barcoo]